MSAEQTQVIKEAGTNKVLAVFYDDGTIRIDGGIISYPHVGKAWSKPSKDNPNPKKVYSASLLLNKTKYKAVKNALVEHNKTLMKSLDIDFVKDENKYMVDGDKTGKPENKDCYVIRTREERKPFVKDSQKRLMSDDDAERDIQGGDIVSMLIRPWPQKSADYGKRLNCGVSGVMKLATGERFGEGRIGEDEIDDRFSDVGPDEAGGGFDDGDDQL